MSMLYDVFLWVMDATIGASLVALLVIAIKKIFHHRISARLHHALWLIVLIRLLFPFLPDSPVSIFTVWQLGVDSIKNAVSPDSPVAHNASQKETEQNSKQKHTHQNNKINQPENQNLQDPSLSNQATMNSGPDQNKHSIGVKLAAIVWLVGCTALLGAMGAYMIRTKSRKYRLKIVTDPRVVSIMDDCRNRFGVTRPIPIYSGSDRKSPHISGLIHPWIYCPAEICVESSTAQLTHVFSHELAHYKRNDLAWNLLGLLALSIHWVNPLVWLCMKQMKTDRELACDAYVLNVLGEAESVPYGMTILHFLQRFSTNRQQLDWLHFNEANNRNQLIRRIQMIKNFQAGSYKFSVAAVLCLSILSSVTLTNAAAKVENTVKAVASDQTEQKARMLFDMDQRGYDRLSKGIQTVDFPFKVPDVLGTGYSFNGMYIDQGKLRTTNETSILIEFRKGAPSQLDVRFTATSGLSGLEAAFEKMVAEEKKAYGEQQKIERQQLNVQGLPVIKATSFLPSSTGNAADNVYYLWEENGIQYNINGFANDPQEDIVNMIANAKYPNQAMKERYVGYSSYVMGLYDTEDIQHGSKAIGFTPKFPLALPGPFQATEAYISAKLNYSLPVNEEDNKTMYLGIYYDVAEKNKRLSGQDRISVDQIKDTKPFEDMKKNGHATFYLGMDETNIVNVHSLNIAGNEVFKTEPYKRFGTFSKAEEPSLTSYFWKENDICFKVTFTADVANQEEIVSYLMNQKAIDFDNVK